MFAAFGVASPFLPGLLRQDGVSAGWLGIVLASGTAIRLLAGPAGGWVADRSGRPVWVLTVCLAASALVACLYAPARGVGLLLLVSVCHAAVLAPLTPLADALALGSAEAGGFVYGWVRGAGSAAFIVGTLASGQAVGRFGLGVIVWLNAGLLALGAAAAPLVPARVAGTAGAPAAGGASAIRTLLAIPAFRVLMIVAALIGGSHALHDGFEVIRWRSAGLSAAQCSVLWAMSVAAEVLVFLWAGPLLLARLGAARALAPVRGGGDRALERGGLHGMVSGDGAGGTAARADIRADAPGMHEPDRAGGAGGPGRQRAGVLRDGGDGRGRRCGQRRVRGAVRVVWRRGVLGDDGDVRGGVGGGLVGAFGVGVRLGQVRLGKARQGKVRQGKVRQGLLF